MADGTVVNRGHTNYKKWSPNVTPFPGCSSFWLPIIFANRDDKGRHGIAIYLRDFGRTEVLLICKYRNWYLHCNWYSLHHAEVEDFSYSRIIKSSNQNLGGAASIVLACSFLPSHFRQIVPKSLFAFQANRGGGS